MNNRTHNSEYYAKLLQAEELLQFGVPLSVISYTLELKISDILYRSSTKGQ